MSLTVPIWESSPGHWEAAVNDWQETRASGSTREECQQDFMDKWNARTIGVDRFWSICGQSQPIDNGDGTWHAEVDDGMYLEVNEPSKEEAKQAMVDAWNARVLPPEYFAWEEGQPRGQ